MLSSIHPLGERSRGNRFPKTATAFVVGSTVGGASTGVLVGGLGQLAARVAQWLVETTSAVDQIFSPRLIMVTGVAAYLFAHSFGPNKLPGAGRQVNEDWLTSYRWWVYGGGFGFQLGCGLAIFITSGLVWLWVVSLFLMESWMWAGVVGATFGFCRGLLILTTRSIRSPSDLVGFHQRLQRLGVPVGRAEVAVLGLLVVALPLSAHIR